MQTASSGAPDLTFPLAHYPYQPGAPHRQGVSTLTHRLAAWRETALIRRALALAGQPNSILHIPCGTGRLWPIFLEKTNRMLIGADDCAEMLAVAQTLFSFVNSRRLFYLKTFPEAIKLPDSAVDCIFCMHLFPLLGDTTHRQQVLREFHRVTRDTLILSLWVDGNLQARRQRGKSRHSAPGGQGLPPRFVTSSRQVEAEFADAGFDILGHLDVLPFWQMTRIYTLRKR